MLLCGIEVKYHAGSSLHGKTSVTELSYEVIKGIEIGVFAGVFAGYAFRTDAPPIHVEIVAFSTVLGLTVLTDLGIFIHKWRSERSLSNRHSKTTHFPTVLLLFIESDRNSLPIVHKNLKKKCDFTKRTD